MDSITAWQDSTCAALCEGVKLIDDVHGVKTVSPVDGIFRIRTHNCSKIVFFALHPHHRHRHPRLARQSAYCPAGFVSPFFFRLPFPASASAAASPPRRVTSLCAVATLSPSRLLTPRSSLLSLRRRRVRSASRLLSSARPLRDCEDPLVR